MSFFYFSLTLLFPEYFWPKNVSIDSYGNASIWFNKELGKVVDEIVVGGGHFFKDL